MARRTTVSLALLTAGTVAGLTAATVAPAAAQGDPVPGHGNMYYLSGAYNTDGQAQAVIPFGDPDDTVYFGDWYGDGVDLPLVRRGNVFFVPSEDDPSQTAAVFAYGDPDDEVYIGDWNGDGVDSIAIRRGNTYFVKNDNQRTGVADVVFSYGDPDDEVLVGNWDGTLTAPTDGQPGKGDTLMVRRGGEYFVRNDLQTGVADYTFYFGDPGDEVLVGDWYELAIKDQRMVPVSGDGADQLAVRRGNEYFQSTELAKAALQHTNPTTRQSFLYGEPDDDVFVASFPTPVDAQGQVVDDFDTAADVIQADGLGVRRSE